MQCEQCRKAEAVVTLTAKLRCSTRGQVLCDPCARVLDLPYPFTLNPLPPQPPPRP